MVKVIKWLFSSNFQLLLLFNINADKFLNIPLKNSTKKQNNKSNRAHNVALTSASLNI